MCCDNTKMLDMSVNPLLVRSCLVVTVCKKSITTTLLHVDMRHKHNPFPLSTIHPPQPPNPEPASLNIIGKIMTHTLMFMFALVNVPMN